jgi:arylsulfatase A-like enzyme
MKKLVIILTVIFISVGLHAQNKPNVIIFMTDDQGYGDMSCNGHPILKTPNLDRLYNEGIHFTDFHVSPYCSPTRASLITGRDFRRVGVWHTFGGRDWLNEEETTIADVFRFNGYATGHFGKWHLGDNYPFAPQFRGFDTSFMLGNSGLGTSDDYWDNDRFDDTYFLNGKPVKTKGFGTDAFVNRALDFIQRHKSEPFFIYLAPNICHQPWNIPSEYRMKYDSTTTDTNEVIPYSLKDMANFYGTIDKIDEEVGRVLAFLKEQNLDNNTIVIFLTDNGTVSTEYNAGMRGRKGSQYEGGHRVPLFIRWPNGRFRSEKEIDELTCHIDIFPTLIDLCGLKTEKPLAFDGQSLKPLIYNNDRSNWNNDRIYISQSTQSVPGRYHVNAPKKGKTVVCKQKWRLINNNELYNLKNDPGQESNIADQFPGVVSELKDDYEKYWNDIQPYTERIARVHIGCPNQPVTEFALVSVTPCQGCSGSWSMADAINARKITGRWPVFVEQSGEYEIELRRWPRELNKAINAFKGLGGRVPMGKFQKDAVQISPESARVKIGEIDLRKTINPDKKSIKFKIDLEKGPTDIQTWFTYKDGTSSTAYWVYISKNMVY